MKTTDKNGREIMVGDTLKLFHFTGARRKKHYMYKYVREIVSSKQANYFNVRHLNISDGGYNMLKDGKQHNLIEIVQGYGADGLPFDQRENLKENS